MQAPHTGTGKPGFYQERDICSINILTTMNTL
jgi:hypothetical protein